MRADSEGNHFPYIVIESRFQSAPVEAALEQLLLTSREVVAVEHDSMPVGDLVRGIVINPVSVSPVRPGAVPRPPKHDTTRVPNWFAALPFILLHVACLAVWWTGADLVALTLCAVCYLVRMFGITAGYHRYFAHRSYKTSRAFQFVLACLGCSALQKGPLWWVGHHRHHHRHADTSRDLHSPRTSSFWWSHVGWVLAPDYDETNWQAVRDWGRYPELRWLNRYHWVPALLPAGLCFLIGGWSGLVWGVAISTVLSFHATFAINSLSHLVGRRRYATPDDSRNNLLLALLTLGEGWHNNHHYYQSSARQGFYWWEIDLSYYLIRLLGFAGVVWDIRQPARHKLPPPSGSGARRLTSYSKEGEWAAPHGQRGGGRNGQVTCENSDRGGPSRKSESPSLGGVPRNR